MKINPYALIICFLAGRAPRHPRGTYESSGGMVQFYYFNILAGEGSCLVLETISLDHRDIPTGFARNRERGKVKSVSSDTMVDV